MRATTIGKLRTLVGKVLKDSKTKYPLEIVYNRKIDTPKYKITIELYEEDVFIDANGCKWIKEPKKDLTRT